MNILFFEEKKYHLLHVHPKKKVHTDLEKRKINFFLFFPSIFHWYFLFYILS